MPTALAILAVLVAFPTIARAGEAANAVNIRFNQARPGAALFRLKRAVPAAPDDLPGGPQAVVVCYAPCERSVDLHSGDQFWVVGPGTAPSHLFSLGGGPRAVDLIAPVVPDHGHKAGLLITAVGILVTSTAFALLLVDLQPHSRTSAPTYAAVGAGLVTLGAGLTVIFGETVTVRVVPRP